MVSVDAVTISTKEVYLVVKSVMQNGFLSFKIFKQFNQFLTRISQANIHATLLYQ